MKTYKIICKDDFYCYIDNKFCKKDTVFYAYDCDNWLTTLIIKTPCIPGKDNREKILSALYSCVWRFDTTKVKDYFFIEQELRKLKLQQLNGSL